MLQTSTFLLKNLLLNFLFHGFYKVVCGIKAVLIPTCLHSLCKALFVQVVRKSSQEIKKLVIRE